MPNFVVELELSDLFVVKCVMVLTLIRDLLGNPFQLSVDQNTFVIRI